MAYMLERLAVSKFQDRRGPVRDTGRQTVIPGLSRAFRDGWQPYYVFKIVS